MSEPIVYLNDRFVPASQAKLNIYDLGIVLGATLTEMTPTFRRKPFRAEDHVARLYRSLKFSGITVPFTPEEMLARTNDLAIRPRHTKLRACIESWSLTAWFALADKRMANLFAHPTPNMD